MDLFCLLLLECRQLKFKWWVRGGFAQAYKELAPEFEKQTGNKLISGWGPSMGITKNAIPVRLDRGEQIDVVIMVGSSLDDLMAQGKLIPGSKVVLANSPIARAVKQGAAKPDISTVAKFKAALLNAKTMAYSDSASGEYWIATTSIDTF